MSNKITWNKFVSLASKEYGISYHQALSDPHIRELWVQYKETDEYRSQSPVQRAPKKVKTEGHRYEQPRYLEQPSMYEQPPRSRGAPRKTKAKPPRYSEQPRYAEPPRYSEQPRYAEQPRYYEQRYSEEYSDDDYE